VKTVFKIIDTNHAARFLCEFCEVVLKGFIPFRLVQICFHSIVENIEAHV
jgi:hypothetical protein